VCGGQANIGIVKEVAVVPRFDAAEAAGVPEVIEWALDIREGKRVSVNGLNSGAIFSPLVKSLGEGSNIGHDRGYV